jgi:predicted AlkP superfamily pyrophosphatase or phosphodiesterase
MDGDEIRSAKGGTHGYYPDLAEIRTGFIASGAGINQGVVVPQMGLEDIAPVIARLLGLDFKAPDGILLPGITK